jgi:hypothetical protein
MLLYYGIKFVIIKNLFLEKKDFMKQVVIVVFGIMILFFLTGCGTSTVEDEYTSTSTTNTSTSTENVDTRKKVVISSMSNFSQYFTMTDVSDKYRLPISISIQPKSGVTVESLSYNRIISGSWQDYAHSSGSACIGMTGGQLAGCKSLGNSFSKSYVVSNTGTVSFNNGTLEGFYKWLDKDYTEYFNAVIYVD